MIWREESVIKVEYIGNVYRPPSEAKSFILQATIGCSHNKCSFCDMYKADQFRVRPLADILADLKEASNLPFPYRRLFIADGDALVLPSASLITIFEAARQAFPQLERIGIYASPKSVQTKTDEELKLLKSKGLDIAYLGLESGDDQILGEVNKGATAKEILVAGQRLKAAGILLSVTLISGLGGQERLREHALHSARILSQMEPDYLGLLTLHLSESTPIYSQVQSGALKLLTPEQVLEELELLVSNLEVSNLTFRSNHASNYWVLAGQLPQDKERLLEEIKQARAGLTQSRSEWMRSL